MQRSARIRHAYLWPPGGSSAMDRAFGGRQRRLSRHCGREIVDNCAAAYSNLKVSYFVNGSLIYFLRTKSSVTITHTTSNKFCILLCTYEYKHSYYIFSALYFFSPKDIINI